MLAALSGVHSRGRFRSKAATTPPPPKEEEGIPHLGEADGLLVHLHQGPDIPDRMESIRSATGLRGVRREVSVSRLERSRDIHGNPPRPVWRGLRALE